MSLNQHQKVEKRSNSTKNNLWLLRELLFSLGLFSCYVAEGYIWWGAWWCLTYQHNAQNHSNGGKLGPLCFRHGKRPEIVLRKQCHFASISWLVWDCQQQPLGQTNSCDGGCVEEQSSMHWTKTHGPCSLLTSSSRTHVADYAENEHYTRVEKSDYIARK